MTYNVFGGTLNLAQFNSYPVIHIYVLNVLPMLKTCFSDTVNGVFCCTCRSTKLIFQVLKQKCCQNLEQHNNFTAYKSMPSAGHRQLHMNGMYSVALYNVTHSMNCILVATKYYLNRINKILKQRI